MTRVTFPFLAWIYRFFAAPVTQALKAKNKNGAKVNLATDLIDEDLVKQEDLANQRLEEHKRALEQLQIISDQKFLMGLSPASSTAQIRDQLVSFAMAANENDIKKLYRWAVDFHGREVMVPILFAILLRSSIASKFTQFIFKELAELGSVDPRVAADWIDQFFYEMPIQDLEFLLHFNDVASNVSPSTFMYMVVTRNYDKALLLYELGCRINTRCMPINLKFYIFDSGDLQLISLYFEPRKHEEDRRAGDVFLEFIKRLPEPDTHIQRRMASLRFNSQFDHFRKPQN